MSEKSSEEVFNGNVESDESWILLKSSASSMDVKSVKDEQSPPEQEHAESEGSSVEVLPNKDENKTNQDNETENVASAPTGSCDHPDGDLSDGISIISETEGAETRSPAIEYLIQETATEEQVEEEDVEEEEEEEEADSVIAAKDGSDQSGFIVNKCLIPSLRPRRRLTPTSSKKRPKKSREAIAPRRDGVSRMLMLGCVIIAVAIVLPFFTGPNAQEEPSKLDVLLDRFESIENHISSLNEDMSKLRHEFEHMRLNVKPPDERKEAQSDANENIEPTETFTINDFFSGLSDIIDTVRENIVTSYDEGNLNIVEPTATVEDPIVDIPSPSIDETYKEKPNQQQVPPSQYDNQFKKEYNKNYKNENHKYPQKPNDHKEYERKDNDHHKQKRNEEWRHDNGHKKDYNKNYNENQKYDKNYKDQSKRNDRKYHQNDKHHSEKYKGETNYDDRKNPENYKGDKDHDSDWYQNMMNHRQEHREKNNENFKNEYNWYIKRGGERERVRDQDEKYHQ